MSGAVFVLRAAMERLNHCSVGIDWDFTVTPGWSFL
jgi:hypothetical protein